MRGEPLFKVDELPVVALYGAVPMYRTLRNRVMGADVWQLQENLLELGYTGFAADGIYTQATATAVLAWQADLGLSQTGMVNLGQVVFTPGPARIAEHVAGVGDLLGNDSAHILNYTNTTRIVTVALNVVHQALAVEGGQSRLRCPTSARWKVSLPRLARWSRQMSLKSR
jgi:membrane fusion protein, multidrug efflux system